MKIFCLAIIWVSLCLHFSNAQPTFQKTYGGSNTDFAYAVQRTTDDGYIVTGFTQSFGAGSRDVSLIRTDRHGNTIWTKIYGGSDTDYGWTVQQTSDGGFIIGTHSGSFGVGSHDVLLIKTNAIGDILWTKVYGGSSADGAYSLQQTADGGYIIAAHTNSFGAGMHDIYLIKTDANGDTVWTKTYGAGSQDYLRAVQQTADGGYIMVAHSDGFGAGSSDVYVVRANENGDTLWTRSYGGSGGDFGYSIRQIIDGGFIIAGYTSSFGAGRSDVYLLKIDGDGDISWAKTYGGSAADYGYSVRQTSDRGFIIAGQTFSFGANGDVYLIRTDTEGNLLWSYAYGGAAEDKGWSVQQANDGGYIIAGHTASFGEGGADIYLIKTDLNGDSGCNQIATATEVSDASTTINPTRTSVGAGAVENSAATIITNTAITETLLCQTVTGLHEEKSSPENILQIYPNPLNSRATLTIPNIEQYPSGLKIVIYDILGREVRRIENIRTGEIEISRDNLSGGVYLYKVLHEKDVLQTGKIMIR